MLSDELAENLSSRFVRDNSRVLDPFCGTGRSLLASSTRGADSVGMDVNPLACLITRAKCVAVPGSRLMMLAEEVERLSAWDHRFVDLDLRQDDRVEWFSPAASRQLGRIVSWINGLELDQDELLILAAVLSATTRDISFARKTGWKLHRMNARDRQQQRSFAMELFAKRLRIVAKELDACGPMAGTCRAYVANAASLRTELARQGECLEFDVVMTSPPYGDSLTTVQYGGISRICMRSVRYLQGLDIPLDGLDSVDGQCLGGTALKVWRRSSSPLSLKPYWNGGKHNEARDRVRNFLLDTRKVMRTIGGLIRPGGRLVIVVGRRLAGGWRVRLDKFIADSLCGLDFELEETWTRKIGQKSLPWKIDRHARARRGSGGPLVNTMRYEHILILAREGN